MKPCSVARGLDVSSGRSGSMSAAPAARAMQSSRATRRADRSHFTWRRKEFVPAVTDALPEVLLGIVMGRRPDLRILGTCASAGRLATAPALAKAGETRRTRAAAPNAFARGAAAVQMCPGPRMPKVRTPVRRPADRAHMTGIVTVKLCGRPLPAPVQYSARPDRGSRTDRRGRATDPQHRQPDQPVGVECDDRGGARRRRRERLRSGGRRGEGAGGADRQGDRGDPGSGGRDPGGERARRHSDRQRGNHDHGDQRRFRARRCGSPRSGRCTANDRRQSPAGGLRDRPRCRCTSSASPRRPTAPAAPHPACVRRPQRSLAKSETLRSEVAAFVDQVQAVCAD